MFSLVALSYSEFWLIVHIMFMCGEFSFTDWHVYIFSRGGLTRAKNSLRGSLLAM